MNTYIVTASFYSESGDSYLIIFKSDFVPEANSEQFWLRVIKGELDAEYNIAEQ